MLYKEKALINLKIISKFLAERIHRIIFISLVLLLEVISTSIITGKLFLTNPLPMLFLSLVIVLLGTLLPSTKFELCFYSLIILGIGVCQIILSSAYTLQGKSIFKIEQLFFINEGAGIINFSELGINFLYVFIILIFSSFFIFSLLSKRVFKKLKIITFATKDKFLKFLVFFFVFLNSPNFVLFLGNYKKYDYGKFETLTTEEYNHYGIFGNFILEVCGSNEKPLYLTNNYLEENLTYLDDSPVTTSEDNNLIIILAESFEYFGYINDPIKYPGGLTNFSTSELETLFPNLYKLSENSLISQSHYSKDKTHNSELSLLTGVIPYRENIKSTKDTEYFFSLPNLFKEKYPNSVTSYFHNNSLDYYSRNSYLQEIGFDNLYGMKETNHQEGDYLIHHNITKSEEMLIDSKMMEASKEKMFPDDQQFFTFWMTLTMHGPYDFNRPVFDENQKKLTSFNHEISNELLNYAISLMDFDKALGTMFNYLESKNLLDKTTIVLTGDHDTYMNNLSLNVKNKERLDMETYQIPLFIYDQQLDYSLIENRFTTTQTILPTILDLFNIPYYKEFYLNDSLFRSDNQYLYAYGFGFFIDKNGLFMTLKDKNISSDLLTERKKLLNCFIKRQQIFDSYNKYYKTKNSIIK